MKEYCSVLIDMSTVSAEPMLKNQLLQSYIILKKP